MNYFPEYVQLALSEIPSEISVVIPLAGCSHCCPNCHSPHLQDKNGGEFITIPILHNILRKYKNKASCVLFFGGEYDTDRLLDLVTYADYYGFKTALYSGYELEELDSRLVGMLDYIKSGSFKEELGGLSSRTTNQRLWKRVDGELVDITAEMQRG